MVIVDINERRKQLNDAIIVLNDGLDQVRKGNTAYYVNIASRLRALVAKGRKNFHPLLLELAKEINYDLECFSSGSMESFRDVLGESTVVNNLVMLHPARYISLVQFSPAQKKYRLDDWLDSKVIVINKNIFTPNEILRSVADKEADHYDLELPDKYLTLKNSMIETKDGKYNEVQIFLSQLGEIVVEWGRNLLEKFEQ